VNIPDTIRREYRDKLNDETLVWDANALKNLETAVMQNITDTFSRFKKTIQYQVYARTKKLAKRYSYAVNRSALDL
jgi:hypothetical protein